MFDKYLFPEIEMKAIGVLLLDMKNRQRYISKLQYTDFGSEHAKKIFTKIKDNINAKPETILRCFADNEEVRQYARTCAELTAVFLYGEKEINEFLEQAIEYDVKTAVQTLAFEESVSLADIEELVDKAHNRTFVETGSFESYRKNYHKVTPKFKTGFPKTDSLLNGGIRQGSIMTVGARPSTGKTTFAINILKAFTNTDYKIILFSLEMVAEMIWDRIISDVMDIDYHKAQNHNLTDEQFQEMELVGQAYNNLNIIDNISDIERMIGRVYADKPTLCIIDYMQIISSQKDFKDNRQRIDHISRLIKKCAKETKCTFLVLSQVTRAGKDEPTMSDLKESGALEQDSDYVLLLHRPYVQDKSDNISPEETKVKIDKNKFGNTGVIDFKFDGRHQRFTEKESKTDIARPINTIPPDDDLPF